MGSASPVPGAGPIAVDVFPGCTTAAAGAVGNAALPDDEDPVAFSPIAAGALALAGAAAAAAGALMLLGGASNTTGGAVLVHETPTQLCCASRRLLPMCLGPSPAASVPSSLATPGWPLLLLLACSRAAATACGQAQATSSSAAHSTAQRGALAQALMSLQHMQAAASAPELAFARPNPLWFSCCHRASSRGKIRP